MRIDYRVSEKDIEPDLLVRAFMRVALKEINRLRAFHGLPDITMAQVMDAIKAELRSLSSTAVRRL